MMRWRRFERNSEGVRSSAEICQDGIRCFIRWGEEGTRRGGSTTVALDDEGAAIKHQDKKVREWLRKGYVEAAERVETRTDPDALVCATITAQETTAGFTPPEYVPVDGFADVVAQDFDYGGASEHRWHRYLVLRDNGRSAITFNVKERSHDPVAVRAFLDCVTAQRDLPFDGRSHQKMALPCPAGPFSHVLFCSPALGRAMRALPTIATKVASAFPIHDCEIGDADPEVLVDARINGRGTLNYTDWARAPHPVIDLRFELARRKERRFKVYGRRNLTGLLAALASATPSSWLEIRSFRGEVKRLTPADVTDRTQSDVDRFVHGQDLSAAQS
jgi:predicted DNA-binding WGR domain protein